MRSVATRSSTSVSRLSLPEAWAGVIAASMTAPPTQTLSEWADANRILSAEGSAEVGRWRTSRAAYLRGIMDAMTDPAVHTVAVEKAAQVGWTEVINNAVGFFIDRDLPGVKEHKASSIRPQHRSPVLRYTPSHHLGLGRERHECSFLQTSFLNAMNTLICFRSVSCSSD